MLPRLLPLTTLVLALGACGDDAPPALDVPPVLGITEPAEGAQVRAGTAFVLRAAVEDPEEGGGLAPYVLWSSSRAGQVARGAQASATLGDEGPHTLTAAVTDRAGGAASAVVTVQVIGAQAPTAALRAPAEGASVVRGAPVEFRCEARTLDGAVLDGDAVTWASALSGPLPSGARVTTDLTVAGADTVTCTATDAARGGAATRVSVHVRVTSS